MKSPITGKEMTLRKEERTLRFRKEEIPVIYHYYLCGDSGEQFTSTELDEINTAQLYNQYRDRHNLPFPQEVREIREKYGLPANRMSEILGFGVNSYRNYENGEVPSHSNGKLIHLANDPKKFKELVAISDGWDDTARSKILRKVDALAKEEKEKLFASGLEGYLMKGALPDEYSGYRRPSLARLTEMVVYFAERLKPWKTQLNKLLFYADFLHFKRTCFSISGCRYRAIALGPVQSNYHSIFEYLVNQGAVDVEYEEFPNGATGEQFKSHPDRQFQSDLFEESELSVLEEVIDRFKKVGTGEIIEMSHEEPAWIHNQADRKLISYKYAFDLQMM